ncbi:nuclease-related domain-containing protein [Cryobacterium psychrophilum]|uniref:NERD domain-containing protein n=1 Tax=Cryobacterium psychrophilum TaxID=41988 RepID=A0A4Y8KRS6_9MICO|nr:nuclease-related domain-containing protein [Cryobacterium psychrophilum]TDW31085.1 nuclease-like protein [Cryobacterium psychrophilum]TFD78614.1 NERD domain-containing protein [Cryobacterium psychrophilum]
MTTQAPTMGERFAAQAVIEELLRQHAGMPRRNTFARLFGYSPLGADSVSWYLGAKGEIEVGRILATLPPEWTVFHALPIDKKGTDIDHLVIGPGGVVTINTKNHTGKRIWVAERTMMVSGHKQRYIRNAEFEANQVTTLLRERMPQLPAVQPSIALVSPKSLTVKKRPARVKVIAATGLRRWLLKLPVTLSAADMLELAAIIDAPGTWPPQAFAPTENVRGRFAALDVEVRAARVRSTLWKVTSFVAVFGGFLLVGPQLVTAIIGVLFSGAP